ncbi:MAG: NAD(P)(+) transhydrogenase (Re/Si-specific) subunit beta, partial [Alphaproteobacteria bacterium]
MNSITYNIAALVLVAAIIAGIRMMSSPKTAVGGNLLGALCMFGAIILTLSSHGLLRMAALWASMAIGAVIGLILAANATMVKMPQLVALFNGLGGGASAIVGLIVCFRALSGGEVPSPFAGSLAVSIGGVTLGGSLVAAAKLAARLPQRPIIFAGHSTLSAALVLLLSALALATPLVDGAAVAVLAGASLAVALGLGAVFAIRIGGADMPITISLLNALSGIAAAVAGFAIHNPLLVGVGAVVGAAGLLLTRIMCAAMNRNLWTILTGGTVVTASTEEAPGAYQDVAEAETQGPQDGAAARAQAASILDEARKIVIVPGYGMALSQAQHQVKRLLDQLVEQGKEVKFGIHPVAGRMPGHMHV